MQGLILAAGRGSRLGGHSLETPKCLLEVARRPLIEHQLAACAETGIAPVAVVTGYCGDEIRQVLGLRAEYINNPRWATTNSIYSFWQARDWVKGPLVVMNCDVLFEPAMLARLLAAGPDSLLYDSSSGKGLEQMKVKTVEGRVVDMSKQLPAEEASGENVGILYFSAETAHALMDKAGEIIAAGGENTWFPAAVRAIAETRPLKAVDIAGLGWAEIDTAWDLDHARRNVWPTIEGATVQRRRRRVFRWLALPAPLTFVAGIALWGGMGMRASGEPPTAFETATLRDTPTVTIGLRDRPQRWGLLEHDGVTTATVDGPGPVRLDSRFVLRDRGREIPYVLRLEIDGKLQDLHKNYARPDPDARHDGWSIARRKAETFDLPRGQHTIVVKLVGGEPGDRCLVRIRTVEQEIDVPEASL